FSLIASLGITTYAIRECSAVRGDKKKLGEKASQIFSINVCTTIVAYVLLGLSLIFFRKLDSYRTLIIIQSTAILFTTWGADWLNSAMEDFKFITIRSIGFQFISLILMFVLVHRPEDYLKYAAITVLSSCGANITNILYRRKYCTVRFTKDMHWREHFTPILLLFVMILAQTVFNNTDTTMLGLMKGDFEVGIYSTAQKMKNIIVQVVASLCWVVMPRMSYYFAEGDWNKINAMLKKVLSVMVTIGFPCVVGCVVLSSEIIQIVAGRQYSVASLPLVILMVSFIVDIFGGSFLGNMVCLPAKQEKVFMEACGFAAVVNVVLNYILIPYGGASAAAFTSGISAIVIFVWLFVKKDKRVKLNYIWEVCKGPLIGSLLIVLFCLGMKQFISSLLILPLVCVLGSVFIYSLTQLAMKNELIIEVLNTIVRRIKR
ncbi:MAG: flippase, partial [Mollicutes bacterium]|nr:flippase [Mollicutes bacterium]